jgi:hypothetical protein
METPIETLMETPMEKPDSSATPKWRTSKNGTLIEVKNAGNHSFIIKLITPKVTSLFSVAQEGFRTCPLLIFAPMQTSFICPD